jgi:hypothetical protein
MKIKIVIMSIIICILLLAGCTETNTDEGTNGENNNNDNSNNDKVAAGWYLKDIVDYDDTGDNSKYGITYTRGNVTTNHYSADGNYELTVRTTWNAPSEYIAEEGDISIDVTKEAIVLNLLLLGYVDESYVKIDNSSIEPGFATASKYYLTDATYDDTIGVGQGDTPDTVKTATFIGKAPKSDGPFDGEFGLTFGISNGPSYGTKYIYEWRE